MIGKHPAIWRPETAAEKKASMIEIQKINEAIEPELRKARELIYLFI
jgi:hypothetical protein